MLMEIFIITQTQQNKDFKNQNIHINKVIRKLASKVNAMDTYNKMLETQIS